LYLKNEDIYDGNWIDDFKNGNGTLYFHNGDKFIGTFEGKFEGIG